MEAVTPRRIKRVLTVAGTISGVAEIQAGVRNDSNQRGEKKTRT